jgi:hypothetical protein
MGEGGRRPGEGSNFRNHARQFVAENGGWDNHPGVITAFEDLQIRSAGQRRLDTDAEFAGLKRRWSDILDSNIFLPMENGRFHAASLEGTPKSLNRILSDLKRPAGG